jgi:hypothetical protein
MRKTLIALGVLLAACGSRDERWDTSLQGSSSHGLHGSVALQDAALNRFLFVTSPRDGELAVTPIPVGKNVTAVTPSPDRRHLFVLSKGQQPRFRPEDERPQLLVLDGGTAPKLERTFYLDDPRRKLALDPRGEWIAAYEADSTVVNPNEIELFSLTEEGVQVPKTIRSFGGVPLELIFTDPLTVPSGEAHRFLVVRTDRDITLLDLSDLERSEVTVQLPQTDAGKSATPVQVVFDDGDPEDPTDARLAVRLQDLPDVVLLDLGPSSSPDKPFAITPNIVDAGGVPSAIDFVRTDGGLRLAALVPRRRLATLVDPETTATETVQFPVPYESMTRITDTVSSPPAGGDVALLWSSSAQGIAFWSLGQTSGTPYRSVDANDIDFAVSEVIDVPAPNRHLKLLASAADNRFFVLDLKKRQTFPMLTSSAGFRVNVSPDGQRLWAFQPYMGEFSSIELSDLHPKALSVRLSISQIHDIKRADGTRAALVLHGSDELVGASSVSVTLLDALNPDSAATRYFEGIGLEGLR